MKSVHEQLRENFERWEIRGRGVLTYPKTVSPRPPFAPFRGHRVPHLLSGVDSVRPTRVSGFLQRAKALVRGENNAAPAGMASTDDEKEQNIEPEWCFTPPPLIEIPMRFPQEMNTSREAMSPLLTSLAYVSYPLVFEIVGTAEETWMQWVVSENDEAQLRQQMQAHFPQAKLTKPNDKLAEMLMDTDEMAVVEFALGEVFMLPLASVKSDPFISLVGALASLAEGELGLYQVIFVPLAEPWAESSLAAVTKQDGQPFFDEGASLVKAAQQKTSGPLYGVVVRLAAAGSSHKRAWRIVSGMAPALRHFSLANGNHFTPLHNCDYDPQDHLMDVINRQTCRCGMVLSIDELTGLVHLPTSAVQSPKFRRLDTSTRAAETPSSREGICLGLNHHDGEASEIWLPSSHRVRHCHILGGTGTGKSTLLFSMIRQDIASGEGIAVLDPHGDLIDRVLGIIPPERVKDVVLFDPADEHFVIPFNILSAHSDFEKQLLASDLVSVFQRLSTSWGDQMNSVFQNAVLAFLESRDGGTLADLRRFLLDAQWREQFLETVSDPDVRFYWKRAFPQLGSGRSIGPIITRLETFLSPKPIRYMVSQRENRLDFREMMDSGKIFLARLPQGLIGRENAFLLGSLIMTKLQQMAMSRARIPESQRRPFYCYIDEFHHFITPSLTEVLSGARKYGLGLVLAHQELKQLDRDKDVGSAVLSNAFNRVVFRVGDSDARALADGFAHFEARDIQSLATGHAIARIERADHDFNLAVPRPEELDEAKAEQVRSMVIDASRESYSIPRQQVEAELLRRLEEDEAKPQPSKQRKAKEDVVIVPAVPPPEPPQPPRVIEPPQEVPVRLPTNTAHEPPLPPPAPTPAIAVDPGKGGHQHRIVQDRIRTVGAQMGFRAHLEMPVGAGRETVDVGLLRHDMRIACEISVTTTIDHEVGNVRKCLREDFSLVAVITADVRRLRQIESAVNGCFEPGEASKVRYFQPDAFIAYLATLTPPPEPEQIPSAPEPKESVRKGYKKPLSGKTPYGYVWKDKKLIQHPAEAPVRKLMYELFLKHKRLGTVARLINEMGYRTRTGCEWKDVSIGRLITDWTAKGIYRINVYKGGDGWRHEIKDESEWGMAPCEPLVSETAWNDANQLLEQRRSSPTKRPGPKPVHLFAGLVQCECGKKMYVGPNTPKYVCTACRNKIPMCDLEEVFVDEIRDLFSNKTRLHHQIAQAQQNLRDKEQLLAAHRQEIDKVRDEMAKTHRLYLDGHIALAEFGTYHQPLSDRLTQLQNELPKLEAELDYHRIRTVSADVVQVEADTLYKNWPQLPAENKRRIIEGIVERIEIKKNRAEIEITFSSSAPSEDMTKNQQNLREHGN